MKPPTSPLFLIIIFSIAFNTVTPGQSSSTLVLIVTTDKPAYYPKENVTIYGNLTQNGILVPDGLVAIQVKDSNDTTLIVRTTTTETPPSATPYVRVLSIIPCNSSGGLKESFKRGTLAYFKLAVKNYDIEPREVLITVNTYDLNNTPFSYVSLKSIIDAQTTSSVILWIPIPEDATLGNSTAYGNAYTDWPSSNGWPYCTEVLTTFLITDEGTLSSTISKQKDQSSTTLQINGNYNTTFKLAPQAKVCNYTIYVASRYLGEETFNTTTFRVKFLGDLDDDGDVDGYDLRIFCKDYAVSP